jgi:superfamily II DNA/RNA helicase/cold shock CspA family protein
MADMGFVPAVRRILTRIPQPRQVQLFSATLGGATGKLVAEAQSSPARHEVGPVGPDMALATHVFWRVERPQRVAAAAAAIRKMGSTIVFCRTRHGADRLVRDLTRAGTSAAAIHGGRSQPQRDKALRSFATGNVTTLVATDVAARGVHVDNVAGIIHLDLPADGDTYVHRSGRTARAGASGTVVTFVEAAMIRDAKAIQRAVGIAAPIGDVDVAQLIPPPVRSAVDASPVATEVTTTVDQPAEPAEPATRTRGTLLFFHDRRGYGFISREVGKDLFVHHRNLPADISLEPGQQVEFAVRPGQKGPEAVDVELVGV